MFGLNLGDEEAAVKEEVYTLARNAPILTGRSARVSEIGLALGVFLYWRLGYSSLSDDERMHSALGILVDCRHCLHVLERRMATIPGYPIPKAFLDSYIEEELENVDSMLGSANQVSHIFAESYLLTIGKWPVSSSWELMPKLASLDVKAFSRTILKLIHEMSSPTTGEAILPTEVLNSSDVIARYGAALAPGFRIRNVKSLKR
jgi:hypothetical protein